MFNTVVNTKLDATEEWNIHAKVHLGSMDLGWRRHVEVHWEVWIQTWETSLCRVKQMKKTSEFHWEKWGKVALLCERCEETSALWVCYCVWGYLSLYCYERMRMPKKKEETLRERESVLLCKRRKVYVQRKTTQWDCVAWEAERAYGMEECRVLKDIFERIK